MLLLSIFFLLFVIYSDVLSMFIHKAIWIISKTINSRNCPLCYPIVQSINFVASQPLGQDLFQSCNLTIIVAMDFWTCTAIDSLANDSCLIGIYDWAEMLMTQLLPLCSRIPKASTLKRVRSILVINMISPQFTEFCYQYPKRSDMVSIFNVIILIYITTISILL